MDFYSLLYSESYENNDEKCLISQESLEPNYITLECNHKFNLLPLYNEVVKQKTMPNILETTCLKINQIKCPYCRTITNKILPYRDISGISHINGVNYPLKYCMKIYNCKWIIKNGKNKGCYCNKSAFKNDNGILCDKHNNMIKTTPNDLAYNNNILNYKKYTIPILKEILKSHNLKISGNKLTLIERLNSINYDFNL